MKRLILLAAMFLFGSAAHAQTGSCGGFVTPAGVCVPVSTVANLRPAVKGALGYVNNGNSATDCTVGGGSTSVLCVYNGSAWVTIASAGTISSGTTNTLSKYTAATTLGDSSISDAAGTVTINAELSIAGGSITSDGDITIDGNIASNNGGLTVDDDITSENGELEVEGNITSNNGGLQVDGDITSNNGTVTANAGAFGNLQVGGNLSAASWTTTGIAFDSTAATYTDTSTAAAGTVAVRTANSFGAPTFASTNAITVADGFTLYVPKPIAGTNTTLTRGHSAYFEGNVGFGTTTPLRSLHVVSTNVNGAFSMNFSGGNNGAAAQETHNTSTSGTAYGGYFDATGASTTNIGGYFGASGASNNYGLIVGAGNVGIGDTTPAALLTVGGSDAFQVSSTGGVIIGSGTNITKHLSATAALDFASLVAIGCEDLTITVTGAALGDTVGIGVPNGSVVANSSYSGWVSSANTVSVRFCALISGDPASGTFRADVWQH